jgi:hypothetical protein
MNKHILPIVFLAVLGSILTDNADAFVVLTAIGGSIAMFNLLKSLKP